MGPAGQTDGAHLGPAKINELKQRGVEIRAEYRYGAMSAVFIELWRLSLFFQIGIIDTSVEPISDAIANRNNANECYDTNRHYAYISRNIIPCKASRDAFCP